MHKVETDDRSEDAHKSRKNFSRAVKTLRVGIGIPLFLLERLRHQNKSEANRGHADDEGNQTRAKRGSLRFPGGLCAHGRRHLTGKPSRLYSSKDRVNSLLRHIDIIFMDELRLREDWSQRLYWVVPIHTRFSSCSGFSFTELYENKPSGERQG